MSLDGPPYGPIISLPKWVGNYEANFFAKSDPGHLGMVKGTLLGRVGPLSARLNPPECVPWFWAVWTGARSTHAEVVNQATSTPNTPNGRMQHLLSHECGSAPPRAKLGLFHLVWFCLVKLILLQGHPPQRASVRCMDFAVAQVTQVSSSLGIEVAVGVMPGLSSRLHTIQCRAERTMTGLDTSGGKTFPDEELFMSAA